MSVETGLAYVWELLDGKIQPRALKHQIEEMHNKGANALTNILTTDTLLQSASLESCRRRKEATVRPVISYYGGKQKMAHNIIPLIPRHTVLTVIREGKNVKSGKSVRRYWVCQCACGNVAEYREDGLKSGRTTRCRQCSREAQKKKMVVHGCAKKRNHSAAYRAWDAMKQRCFNEKQKHFKQYGGRGIVPCSRWMVFKNFLEDMGEPPSGMTLDRIDNEKGYSKDNCRWASRKTQQNNRRTNRVFTFNGETKTAQQWCEVFGVSWNTVRGRISRGWDEYIAFQPRTGAFDCFARKQETLW
jgi:hypothetical protein